MDILYVLVFFSSGRNVGNTIPLFYIVEYSIYINMRILVSKGWLSKVVTEAKRFRRYMGDEV